MGQRKWIVVLSGLLAAWCASVMLSAMARADEAAALPQLGVDAAGQPVLLHALDDPANPYRGQYSAYDEWVFSNRKDWTPEQWTAYYGEEAARDPQRVISVFSGETDSQGYLIPQAQVHERQRALLQPESLEGMLTRDVMAVLEADRQGHFFIQGAGKIPAEIKEVMYADIYAAEARELPPIPAWLGTRPPLQTICVPNGEFLCYGQLGAYFVADAQGQVTTEIQGQLWYRYSAEGKLLGTYDLGGTSWPSDWQSIYWPERSAKVNELSRASGGVISGNLGFTVFPDSGGKRNLGTDWRKSAKGVLAAFDYDGSAVDPKAAIPAQRQRLGTPVDQGTISHVYKLQVTQGKTSAASLSPYAGLPDGPQLADPQPQVAPRIAWRENYNGSGDQPRLMSKDSASNWVALKPLDDPANPYRGQYREWDVWLQTDNMDFDQFIKQRQQQGAERERQAAAYEARGEAVPEALRRPVGTHMFAESDEAFKNYGIEVDANGYILPAVLSFQHDQERAFTYDYRNYSVHDRQGDFRFQASGVMPAEMLREYQLACWGTVAARYPRLPSWLVDAPTFKAAIMPNGDILTEGQAGSWNADTSVLYDERWYARDTMHCRYSPAGQLLMMQSQQDWAVLYDLNFNIDYGVNGTPGYGQHPGTVSFFPVFDGPEGQLTAAYDYDGLPLDISQPLLRPDGYGRWLRWEELQSLYAAQQAANVGL